jgi:hypothetical protein
MKTTYRILLSGFLLGLAVAMLCVLSSCEKEQTYLEHPGPHYDSALFIFDGNSDQYILVVECWGSGLWVYSDSTYLTPAYDLNDPGNGRTIFYRRYKAWAFIDSKFEYMGWDIVQDTNFVDREHLDHDTIELSPCNK